MKFKIDENLPIEVTSLLKENGYDAITVLQQDLRVRSKINSQNWRLDLGRVWLLRLSEATGIASYFEDFTIEQRPKMA
ncbi:MAG: hypothetical protein KKH68_00240 [Proteobacteria bacterium]|nr:hypothetical protein [Pseudomonadota bacterium]